MSMRLFCKGKNGFCDSVDSSGIAACQVHGCPHEDGSGAFMKEVEIDCGKLTVSEDLLVASLHACAGISGYSCDGCIFDSEDIPECVAKLTGAVAALLDQKNVEIQALKDELQRCRKMQREG